MTIDEATKELKKLDSGCGGEMKKSKDALRLGIEALKFVQSDRLPSSHPLYATLPGETKEC